MQRFSKICAAIRKLIGGDTHTDTQTARLSHMPISIFSKQGKWAKNLVQRFSSYYMSTDRQADGENLTGLLLQGSQRI
jgi:hypothetical protein